MAQRTRNYFRLKYPTPQNQFNSITNIIKNQRSGKSEKNALYARRKKYEKLTYNM